MNKKCEVERCNRAAKPGERFCSECKRDRLYELRNQHPTTSDDRRHTEERGRKQPIPLGDHAHGSNEDEYHGDSKPNTASPEKTPLRWRRFLLGTFVGYVAFFKINLANHPQPCYPSANAYQNQKDQDYCGPSCSRQRHWVSRGSDCLVNQENRGISESFNQKQERPTFPTRSSFYGC